MCIIFHEVNKGYKTTKKRAHILKKMPTPSGMDITELISRTSK